MRYERIRKEIAAYNEIARYNLQREIDRLTGALVGERLIARFQEGSPVTGFPEPPLDWVDSRANPVSQLQAYRWLSPIGSTRFLQLGGSGSHAIKAIIGGAGEAWLLTPMTGEGVLARHMASHLGVPSSLNVVGGIGEQLPLRDSSIDRIYGGGTLHHVQLRYGLSEVARVLAPGGRAAFVDPSLNLVYRFLELTRIRNLARERGAQCYPLRVADIYDNAAGFRTVRCLLAGGPLRYATVGLTRILRLRPPLSLSLAMQSTETIVLNKLRLHGLLGGLAVLLEK